MIDLLGPLDVTAPEDRPLVEEQIRRRLSGEVPFVHYEFKGMRKDGRRIDIEALGNVVQYQGRPAIQGTFQDVTARKEAEAEIRRLKEFNERIVQGMEEGILIEDAQGFIIFANPKIEEMLGYDRGQIVGLHWTALVSSAEVEAVSAQLQRRPFGVKSQYETNLLRRDGSLVPVIVSATPLFEQGRYAGVLSAFTDITGRKRAEEALREERNFIAAVLDTAGALVVVLDREGRIVRFNRACEQTTGYTADEVMGREIWDFLLAPEEKEDVKAVFADLRSGRFPSEHENYWMTKDGRRRRIAWANTAITDADGAVQYVIATGIDITERKRAEGTLHALNAAAMAVQQAQDSAGVYRAVSHELARLGYQTIIALWDETGQKITINHIPALNEEMLRAFIDEHGQPVSLPVLDPQPLSPILQELRTLCVEDLEEVVLQVLPEGEQQEIARRFLRLLNLHRSIVAPLVVKGRAIGLLAVISPLLTERDMPAVTAFAHQTAIALENARLYETLRERAERLEQAYSELKKLDRMKDEFVQNISHELRTPLTFIRSYVDLMLEGMLGPITDEQRESLQIVANRTEGIIRLVGDIISLKRAEMAELELMTTSLAEIARLSVRGAEVTAKEAGLKIVLDVPDDLPLVQADPQRIYQVFDNLLGNAIKFSNAGGTITVRLRCADGFVRAEVADQGIGIPASHLDRIWERFYQVDGTSTRRFGGAGLGRAIVKRIIEAHGGTVGVESVEGKGSTFFFTVPQASVPDAPAT